MNWQVQELKTKLSKFAELLHNKPKKEEDMSRSDEKVLFTKWMKRGSSTFIPTDNSKIVPQVDAGVYELRYADGIGFYMFKKEIKLDDLIQFPKSVQADVIEGIKHFHTRKDKFKEYGYTFKRGILLHGKPGCGKTSIMNIINDYIVKNLDGIVITLKDKSDLSLYKTYIPEVYRVIEPDRLIVVTFEDLENFCYGEYETLLLNILDGIDQLENVIYLASTNYIERLKERIINRPSRFDRRVYMPMPNASQRSFYFRKKLKKHDLQIHDIKQWVKDTKNMSIAHLAELIKSVVILGNTYEDSIKTLRELTKYNELSSDKYEASGYGKIGFNNSEIDGESYEELDEEATIMEKMEEKRYEQDEPNPSQDIKWNYITIKPEYIISNFSNDDSCSEG